LLKESKQKTYDLLTVILFFLNVTHKG